MLKVLKLMRIQNLLFIIGFQLLMRYAVIQAILINNRIDLTLPTLPFILLLVATFTIVGAGYIINGYFDTRIDAINKPDQVIVGRTISRRLAISLHQILSLIGVVIGLYLGWRSGKYQVGCSFIFLVGLLWFYSSSYKRQFLIGNMMSGVVAGMTLLYVVIFDGAYLKNMLPYSDVDSLVNVIWTYVINYALMFGLITFLLGIIKDQINEPGDRELECHTLPIVWGSKGAKIVITILCLFIIAFVGHIYYHGILHSDQAYFYLRYILSFIILPVIVCYIMNIRTKVANEFIWSYRVGQFVLLGLALFSVLNWYFIVKT